MSFRIAIALVPILVLGCGKGDDEETGGMTSDPTFGSGLTDDETAGGDGGGERLDAAAGSGSGGVGGSESSDLGCEKVDFLFVVDNTNSMADEQAALIDSLPGFIIAIRDTLGLDDFHIMVIDSDADSQFEGPDDCDNALGAGRLTDFRGNDCGIDGDRRYLLPNQADLGPVFECLGDQGINGDNNERVAAATMEAIGPQAQAGACNEGFLRDDALLVVTLITDEEDDPDDGDGGGTPDENSPGGPPQWAQAIVDAKGGREASAVVVGLLGDTDLPGATCQARNGTVGAEAAPRLRAMVEAFTYGAWSPICTGDYDAFFLDTVDDLIAGACAEFTPPG